MSGKSIAVTIFEDNCHENKDLASLICPSKMAFLHSIDDCMVKTSSKRVNIRYTENVNVGINILFISKM